MSTTIDQRVVEMRLDNKQFEANAQASISTLSKLRQSLNLTGASKGLENVAAAAKNNNMGVLGSAVESVGVKFNALQVMGVTALANLTNSAVTAGTRMVKALTIDPVKTGFSEYELKMDSIKTIMASTGETLEVVNKYLAELNEYSDQTIYSFSDMTSNIGKFTNAGVKLEDAVMAIKGISNEAALSGANANEASRAMYNFAQALSTGSVKLIDWKSIENANMATVEFKEELIKTALELGTVKKVGDQYKTTTTNLQGKTSDLFSTTKAFNDSLSHQWMTSEVLIKTLKRYSDETTDLGKKAALAATEVNTFSKMMDTLKESAQSGWAQSWEIILGDATTSKNMWTLMSKGIGSVIDSMSDARNTFLENVMASPWERLTKEINAAGIETDDFRQKLFATAKAHDDSLADMKYSEKKFNELLKDGKITKDVVLETLTNMISGNKKAGKSTEDLQKKLKKFQKVVDQVWQGDFKNGTERIKLLTEAGYDYAEVQELVNKTVDGHRLTLEDLSDAQLEAVGYTKEEIASLRKLEQQAKETGMPLNKLIEDLTRPTGRELIGNIFKNLGEELGKLKDVTKEAWSEVFGDKDAAMGLYNIIENLKKLTDEFTITEEQAKSFKDIVQGAFSAVELTWNLTGLGMRAGLKIVQAVLELFGTDLLTVAGHIGELITKFANWAQENTIWWGYTQNIAKIIYAIVDGVYKCVKAFLELEIAGDIIDKIAEWLSNLFGGVDFEGTTNHIEGLAKIITDWFNKVAKVIKSIDDLDINISWDSFKNFIDYLSEKIPGFKEFVDTIRSFKDEVTEVFKKLSFEHLGFDAEAAGGNIVEGLKKGITSKYSDAVAAITNLGNIIKEAFCRLLGIESPSKVFMAFGGWIVMGLGKGIISKLSLIGGAIKSFAKFIINTFCEILGIKSPSKVFIALGGFIVAGLIYGLEDSTSLLGSTVKSLVTTVMDTASEAVKKGLPYLINTIGDIFGNLLSELSTMDIDFGSLFVVGTIALIAFFLNKILKLLQRLVKPLDGIADVLKSLSGALDAFKDIVKARKMAVYADALKSLAIAIAIMVGSLMVLTKIDLKEDWDAILVMAGLIGALIGMAAMAQKVQPEAFAKLALFGLGMSAALWIIASAIEKLAAIDFLRALGAVANFALLIGAFAGLMAVYGKFNRGYSAKYIDKAGILIAKIGLSIGVIALAIRLLSSVSIEDVVKGMLVIAGVGVLFGAIISIAKNTGEYADEAGKLLLKMSIAIGIIALTIKLISTMSASDIIKGLTVIAAVELLFAGIIKIAKNSGEHASQAGNVILKMSLAIGILAIAIKVLADIPAGDIVKGMLVIASSALLFKAFIKMANDAGTNAPIAGSMLWKMAAAIGILAIALRLLAGMSVGDIAKGLIIIAALELMFVGFIKLTDKSNGLPDNAGDSFKKMAVAILILAAAIAILSVLDTKKVLGATAAISAIILCLSLLTHVSKLSEGTKINIGGLITMAAVVAILAGIIALLTIAGDPKEVLSSALSLSLLVAVLAGVLKMISTMPVVSKGAIGNMALLGLVVGELAIILGLMAHFNVEPSIETSTALVILLGGLALVCYLMSGLGDIALPAAVGILAFGGLIAELALVLAALGALNKIPGLNDFIESGGDLLNTVGSVVGEFVGSIIGGIGVGVSNSLVTIGTNLSKFMDEASGFIDGAKTIDSSVAKGMMNLAKAVVTITGAGILEKFSSLFVGESSFSMFAKELKPLGEGLSAFAKEVEDVDGTKIEGAVGAIKKLVEIADIIPNSGGLAGLIAGENDMSVFGTQLESFGGSLKTFYNSVKDIEDPEKLNSALKAVRSLAKIAENLPSSGGWLGKIFGETDLSLFGTQFESVGSSLNKFVSNLGDDFGKDQVEVVKYGAKAITSMAEAAAGIDGQSEWAKSLFGDNSIATFASELPSVATALKNFVKNLGDDFGKDKIETVRCAVDAIAAMSKASESIDGQSEWAKKIFGDNSIAGFSEQMPGVASNLKEFVKNLGTFDDTKVKTVKCAVDAIASMAKAGKGIDGQSEWAKKVFGENGLGGIAGKMPDIGSKLKAFASNLGEFSDGQVSAVKSATKAIKALATLSNTDLEAAKTNLPGFSEAIPTLSDGIRSFVNNMPETGTIDNAISNIKKIVKMTSDVAESKIDGVTDFTNGLSEMGEAGVSEFVTAFTSEEAKTNVMEAAKNLLKKAVEGAESQKKPFKTAASDVASAAASALKADSLYWSFYEGGVFLGAGLVCGIEAQYDDAYNAGFKLGQKAVQGEKDGQESNSPSEATKRAGRWLGEGLVIGINSMAKKVYTAGQDLGTNATDSMSTVVSRILDAINTDIDLNPTITPVLDLSGVSESANKLNGMLNMKSSIGVNANVRSISTMMNRMNQNGANDGVISAIDKLRSELGNIGGDTYIVEGVTYDDGSNVSDAVKTIIRAAKKERRT